jgi:cardiolipin synthase
VIRTPRALLLISIAVLGLAPAACARVQSPFALPDLAVSEPSFSRTAEAYAVGRVAGGNTVTILLNGDEIFPKTLEAIRSANRTITYAQYFYEEGPISREIAEALAERCQAGIRGHVLLDGFGTLAMPAEYRDVMERAGCEVAIFRPLSPLTVLSPFGYGKSNNRSHRRILVVDGKVGFTGGVGVSPKWMGNGRMEGYWRQTDVRVEGPIIVSLQGAFVENWLEATGRMLGGDAYFPHASPHGTVAAQVIHSSPAGGSSTMYTMFLLAISGARHSIQITNPYFLPDDRMIRALTEAAGRGVRVVILLPGAIDNNIVRHASRSKLGELLKAGIEVYEYKAALLHAKTMTIDAVWATVGSTNLDPRSFGLNEELNLVVYDREVAERLDTIFAEDLTYSRKIDYEQWRSRGVVDRLLELLSLPARGQL